MSDTVYLTFEYDADHPETNEEWQAFFTKSKNLAFCILCSRIKAVNDSSDSCRAPNVSTLQTPSRLNMHGDELRHSEFMDV